MRDLKFKAISLDTGKWIYGYGAVLHKEENLAVIIGHVGGNLMQNSQVIPETVCQFTGLLDKNGVEIWEGDLFQVARNQIYTVKFSGGHEHNYEWFGGCFAMFLDDEVGFPFDEYAMQNGMVIGNIHDK